MNPALELAKFEDYTQYYSFLAVGTCTFLAVGTCTFLAVGTCTFLAVGTCIVIISLSRLLGNRKLEVNIPLEGSSGVLSSYVDAYDFIANARAVLGRAYKKHGKGTFKIPQVNRFIVIINKREIIEEVTKTSDNKASFGEAIIEDHALSWTFGEKLIRDAYHLVIVRNQLTRSLGLLFNDIHDEIMRAFNELIPMQTDNWIAIPALDTARKIVCRANNRIFVGVPLCRNSEYSELSIDFTIDVMKTVYMIQDTPTLLRPIVGAYFNPTARGVRKAVKLLRPIFEDRFRMYDENGDDWSGKLADMISWLIDEAPKNEKRRIRELTLRLLHINFGSMHTTSNSLTHALFHLAAETQYISPLREEIEQIIKEEGWSKAAMTKMWKLDSFLKESQRLNGIQLLTLSRKIMSDFTLTDGTFLPTSTFVAANVEGIHRDDFHYPDADGFDGSRLEKLRKEGSGEGVKHQMANTSPEYLAFGHGRHACPGRFFAVNELKAMMAYLILNYDVKAEVEGVRPESVYHRSRLSPNPTAKVMFRKRADA